MQDGAAVYEFDLDSKEREALLVWTDCGIGGSWVESVGALEDGRLFAALNDWSGDKSGAALLVRTEAGVLEQRETIVIGTLENHSHVREAAERFNTGNEKYKVVIQEYPDETALNLDIVSGRCPDIIEFGNFHAENMIEKGMFEDMESYLEKSDRLSRDDFYQGILNAYVFDGILVALPNGFLANSVAGRSEDVGTKIGWTLDEMFAFAEAHPDRYLFDDDKWYVMWELMRYNEGLFVDWERGQCSFDSEQFIRLLELVNGSGQAYGGQGSSSGGSVRESEPLLRFWTLDFEGVQVQEYLFDGEVTFVGLPTSNATSGVTAEFSTAYGITTRSGHKEAAWEFLETLFVEAESYELRFPALKRMITPKLQEVMRIEHDGVVYGEHKGMINGEPYTYRVVTQEEVDRVLALVDALEPLQAQCDQAIQIIIYEEAESYYQGQKTAEEVAKVIQGRVRMYIGEKVR